MGNGPTPEVLTLEIACDESGYEGMRLFGGMTDVFAHASVTLDRESSAACIADLRQRIRSPAVEYKANHLLRERHRTSLVWFLGPEGPVQGKAWVYLTEKPYLLVMKMLDLLAPEYSTDEVARALHRHDGISEGLWERFLVSSNAWLRAKDAISAEASQMLLVNELDRVAASTLDHGAAGALEAMRLSVADGITRPPSPTARSSRLALDPLLAAIFHGVTHWNDPDLAIAVTHDRQNTLTGARISVLDEMLQLNGLRMESFTLVDSRADSRVQVADFLAGVARRITEDILGGRVDLELAELIRPYIDPLSIWGDSASWAKFAPN